MCQSNKITNNFFSFQPTYQNWKKRIESNVNKFLSNYQFNAELNKNTVREQLRKHLHDGYVLSIIKLK